MFHKFIKFSKHKVKRVLWIFSKSNNNKKKWNKPFNKTATNIIKVKIGITLWKSNPLLWTACFITQILSQVHTSCDILTEENKAGEINIGPLFKMHLLE